jgi:hypothetical protein
VSFKSVIWALVVGAGAVMLGMFVGFLVKGPPTQRPPAAHVIASMLPLPDEPPPPAAREFVDARIAAATEPPEPPPAPAQLPAGGVREVQGRLRAIGYNPGPVDGSVGPLTVNAAKQYQRTRGMMVTGAVDHDLLGRLRQERLPPPPRRAAYATATASAQPKPRDDFFGSLERLFRR